MSFRKAREKTGMTQKELAASVGVDQSTVCLWETGKTAPRGKLILKIAEILKCTADDLLSPDPPAP